MGYVVPPMPRPRPMTQSAAHQCACTQCGAPHEAHASVCGYCLSPRLDLSSPDMVEVTSLGDSVRCFVPVMQDEYFRK